MSRILSKIDYAISQTDNAGTASELQKVRDAVTELLKTSKSLRDECLKSVEYSDWPELQKCVKKFDKAAEKMEPSND